MARGCSKLLLAPHHEGRGRLAGRDDQLAAHVTVSRSGADDRVGAGSQVERTASKVAEATDLEDRHVGCVVRLEPDPDRLRKACSRSRSVILYSYGKRAVPVWWEKHQKDLQRFDKLKIYEVPGDTCAELATLAAPAMDLQCTITDGDIWLTSDSASIEIKPSILKP